MLCLVENYFSKFSWKYVEITPYGDHPKIFYGDLKLDTFNWHCVKSSYLKTSTMENKSVILEKSFYLADVL